MIIDIVRFDSLTSTNGQGISSTGSFAEIAICTPIKPKLLGV
jgi:hypothetical protein